MTNDIPEDKSTKRCSQKRSFTKFSLSYAQFLMPHRQLSMSEMDVIRWWL